MQTRPIRFVHRGQLMTVADAPATRTVLQYLREDLHCTGTKEGCAEGDCGACTVVVGELDEHGELALRNVNACIQFLPTLDGKALFTVEDLKPIARTAGCGLHPAQEAMVECHGSQCGFCTPGFVMSLWHSYERHRAGGTVPSRQELADALAGNLCRCTGYRPILDAGQRMFDLPAVPFDRAPVVEALRGIAPAEGAELATRGGRFFAPRTLDELAGLREILPLARLLAGSTDVGLWVTKQRRELGDIIYLGDVAELRRIETRDGTLHIGAGATLEAAWGALVAHYPTLAELWLRFASPPIRHAGTLGGNVANGSPIGDSPPALIALDARIELRRGQRVRTMPLADFYLDYMKNALESGEFVQGLEVPLPAAGQQVRGYKISKRFDSDISAVCLGLSITLEGERVGDLRIAFGGMAATVRRAPRAEAAVRGQPWTEATARAAMAALAEDFQPLTDMRASAAYRMKVAQNLLLRGWMETRPHAPLAASQTLVWSDMPHVLPAAAAPAA